MFSKKINGLYIKLVAIIFICIFAVFIVPLNDNTFAQANDEEVYLGGYPVGITLHPEGLVVEDFKVIITENGNCYPAKESGIMIGDMIISANGITTKTPLDLEKAIGKEPSKVEICLIRSNGTLNLVCNSVYDPIAGSPKLGLIVKNEINGVGTITYFDKNNNFCALGHKITDSKAENFSLYQNGLLFDAKVIGVYKGQEGEAGALKGIFDKNSPEIGKISRNCNFGIYGSINSMKFKNKIKLGSKDEINLGKAYIYSTISGSEPQKYEIEIVKTINQNKPDVKSMVIRVTDNRLIDATGGIVQGMSGSPIVQNDKLVGAVTHVFLNDAKLGYGVYIDWLK